jgi:hypothetical protein
MNKIEKAQAPRTRRHPWRKRQLSKATPLPDFVTEWAGEKPKKRSGATGGT